MKKIHVLEAHTAEKCREPKAIMFFQEGKKEYPFVSTLLAKWDQGSVPWKRQRKSCHTRLNCTVTLQCS